MLYVIEFLIKCMQFYCEGLRNLNLLSQIQAWIAQLVAHWLCTMEVMGSNPGKGEDFSLKKI